MSTDQDTTHDSRHDTTTPDNTTPDSTSTEIAGTGAPASNGQLVAHDATIVPADTTAPATAGGATFDFVFNGVTYTSKIVVGTAGRGFIISQGATTVASLDYVDENNWSVAIGLPSALKVDDTLTINSLNLNVQHGTVTALS